MKTFVLLALLSTCAVGQDTLDINKLRESPHHDQWYLTSPAIDIVVNYVLQDYWDEWVDSCWADSTVWYVRDIQDSTILTADKKYIVGWLTHPETTWVHRDPNNLKEFMEFFRRKPEKGRR